MLPDTSTILIIALSRHCSLSLNIEVDCQKQQTYILLKIAFSRFFYSKFVYDTGSAPILHRSSCSILFRSCPVCFI